MNTLLLIRQHASGIYCTIYTRRSRDNDKFMSQEDKKEDAD